MALAVMLALFLALAVVAPRLLPAIPGLRSIPGPALVLWQGTALGGTIAGLLLAPVAILQVVPGGHPRPQRHLLLAGLAIAMTCLLLARLLLQGHRTGLALRRARRSHAHLLDLIGEHRRGSVDVTVLDHPTPTAYCIPGAGRRVVLTKGALDALDPVELAAVLAHERDHLRARHDLLVEFFAVLDSAVPAPLRSPRGMPEVALLVELLADRRAAQVAGPSAVARAMVKLADGRAPATALAAGGAGAVDRLAHLRDLHPHRIAGALTAGVGLALPVVPVVVAVVGVLARA